MSEEPFTYPIARFRNRKVRLVPPGSFGGGGGGAGGTGAGISGQWVTISTVTATNVANVTFTNLNAQFVKFEVTLEGILPVTDAATFHMLTSTDNGATFATAALSYDQSSGASTTAYQLTGSVVGGQENTAATGAGHGTITIFKPLVPAYVAFQSIYTFQPAAAAAYSTIVNGGIRTALADVDAIRFLFSAGNISTGTFRLRGQLP